MKAINVFSISSAIHNQKILDERTFQFLDNLKQKTSLNLNYQGDNFSLYDDSMLNLIFIRTGGSEGRFKELYPLLKGPYYLLTTGEDNSLAASMEILSFLRNNGEAAEIIHGSDAYVAQRITVIATVNKALGVLTGSKFGVVGMPSDWLIASKGDYAAINQKLGVDVIDITMDEFIAEINKCSYPQKVNDFMNTDYDSPTMETALNIYGALSRLVEKYNLSALTVRCFDLLGLKRNTSCLALAILNRDGITAACEGDVPAMLSMAIVRALTGKSCFQANPSSINVETNEIIFAHCTVPFDMLKSYKFDSHFESGLGIAIKGDIPEGKATIFKTSGDLKRHFVSNAELERNLSSPHLCRTQVVLKPHKKVDYFLKESIGNHHIILLGEYENLIDEFFKIIS